MTTPEAGVFGDMDVLLAGWATKEGGLRHSWRRRYCAYTVSESEKTSQLALVHLLNMPPPPPMLPCGAAPPYPLPANVKPPESAPTR